MTAIKNFSERLDKMKFNTIDNGQPRSISPSKETISSRLKQKKPVEHKPSYQQSLRTNVMYKTIADQKKPSQK